jgi:hypothetical protein
MLLIDVGNRLLAVDPSPQRAHMEGFITKQGEIYQTWKRRYFVVNHDFTIEYDTHLHAHVTRRALARV